MTPTRKNKAAERKKRRRRWGAAAAVTLIAACGIIIWNTAPFQAGSGKDAKSPPQATAAAANGKTPANSNPSPSPGSPSYEVSAKPEASVSPLPSKSPAGGDASDRVSMSFVGDVLLGSTVENLMKMNGFEYPYQGVANDLSKPDLTVANLETPVTDKGTVQKKEYVYRSSPQALPAFKAAGFDLVNLANNHVMDYGAEGLTDTFAHLNNAGILYTGAGRNAEEAFKSVIVEKKGMKIAFLGFSRVVPDNSWKAGVNHPGVADAYNPNLPAEAVKKAREQADLVVVIAHWGVERKDTPELYQTDLAHRFIDAGADLVIGGHPHVLQGFEQYKGKWIAYSLGNFIFTTNNVRETLDTMILNASCSKDRKCELNAVPVFTQWAKPILMNAEDSRKLFEHLTQISFGAAVDSGGNIVNK